MAEGYAKATRKVGVCIVTRGPGATNASIAIHSAKYDSVPLVLLVGQVGRGARGREAGQEIDYTHFFGTIAKWVIEINDAKQIPRIMTRAFHLARSGRPGPVVVSLPRDVIEENADITMIDPYQVGAAESRPGGDRKLGRAHQRGAQAGLARRLRHAVCRRMARGDRLRGKVSDSRAHFVQAPGCLSQQSPQLRRQSCQRQPTARGRWRQRKLICSWCSAAGSISRPPAVLPFPNPDSRMFKSTPTKHTSVKTRGRKSASSPTPSRRCSPRLNIPVRGPTRAVRHGSPNCTPNRKTTRRPKNVRPGASPWNE